MGNGLSDDETCDQRSGEIHLESEYEDICEIGHGKIFHKGKLVLINKKLVIESQVKAC